MKTKKADLDIINRMAVRLTGEALRELRERMGAMHEARKRAAAEAAERVHRNGFHLGSLSVGSDVVLRGTVDAKRGRRVAIVFDGARVGVVVSLPWNIVAEVTGYSPNYQHTRQRLRSPVARRRRKK